MAPSPAIPSALAGYRLRLRGASLWVPERFPLEFGDLAEPCKRTRQEVAAWVRRGPPRPGPNQDLERLQGQLLLAGSALVFGVQGLTSGLMPPGVPGVAGRWLLSWFGGALPLLLQPWSAPLDPLPGKYLSRAPVLEVERETAEELVLRVRSGDLAAFLARLNHASPEPLPGDGGERGRGLSPSRGVGLSIVLRIGILAAVLAWVLPS